MNSRVRIIIMVVSLVLVTMGLALWRFISLNETQQVQTMTKSAERQAAAAAQLVQMSNTSFQERLIDLVSREQTGRQLGLSPATEEALNKALAASPFQAIALLKFSDRWQTAWWRQRQNLSGRWPDTYAKSVLQDLPVEGAKNNIATWFRVTDPGQQPVFLFLTPVRDGADSVVAVGFLPSTALHHVSEAFLSTGTELAVVDERGIAVSFTEQAYVGAAISEAYPPVNEVLRRREVSSTMNTHNRAKSAMFAASQKIDNSNLYVIASMPLESGWALVPRLAWALLFFAIAMSLAGVAAGFWTILPLEQAIAYMSTQLTSIAHNNPVGFFSPGNRFLDPLHETVEKLIAKENGDAPTYIKDATAAQSETQKMGAYKEMSAGLADALKDPLAQVLAQAQLARAKAQQDNLKEHFVVIERETRKARDTIENLLRLTGEDRFPRARIEVQDVVLAALAGQKGAIASNNVRVLKELAQSAPINANSGQLQTALEEVIKNAIEAMQKNPERVIKVVSKVGEDNVTLTVEDHGVGLDSTQIPKVFDPFYTLKKSDDHKGLGLTVAKGIIKSLGGKIRLESEGLDKGTKVVFEFPVTAIRHGKAETKPLKETPAQGDISRPLSGTATDPLPTAPALDEVTFTGVNHKMNEAISPDIVKGLADGTDFIVLDDVTPGEDNDAVTVRSPKTKEPGT